MDVIQVMESTIAARDPYTVGHQQRATYLACLIAAEMDFPKASLKTCTKAAAIGAAASGGAGLLAGFAYDRYQKFRGSQ